jgi:predicted aminopeptidase
LKAANAGGTCEAGWRASGFVLRTLRRASGMVAVLALGGCASVGYTLHVARGQVSLLVHRQSVAKMIDDPRTVASLRARLRQAQAARDFASERLALPRNRSYTSYVELGRPFVTWNVFATPEFSVEPVTHCFPFAGCVAYMGFFDRELAQAAARDLSARGDDTQVEGAAAYSTLGWFNDPILSSMLRWDDDELDGVIFHELSHQVLYVKDDTAFNESFASFVQDEGLREWRLSRGLPRAPDEARAHARDEAFTHLVLDLRERLRKLYATDLAPDAMRTAKQGEFSAFRECYAMQRDREWAGDAHYDHWVAAPINNARLLPFGLYDRWVPAFAHLFEQAHHDLAAFQARAAQLAHEPAKRRECLLSALARQDAVAETETECRD